MDNKRFNRLVGLLPHKAPKKKFAVTIIDPDIDQEDVEECPEEVDVFMAGTVAVVLIVEEPDLKALQRIMNQNEMMYSVQPYKEENHNTYSS